jgi:hypothetical protein
MKAGEIGGRVAIVERRRTRLWHWTFSGGSPPPDVLPNLVHDLLYVDRLFFAHSPLSPLGVMWPAPAQAGSFHLSAGPSSRLGGDSLPVLPGLSGLYRLPSPAGKACEIALIAEADGDLSERIGTQEAVEVEALRQAQPPCGCQQHSALTRAPPTDAGL